MKFFVRLVLYPTLIFFAISACDDSKKVELKLISDYEFQLGYIFKAHMQNMAKHTTPEQYYEQQLTSIKNFAKVKEHFARYHEMVDLSKVVEIYEFALIHLYRRNAQIWEMAIPLWKSDPEKLTNIKNDEYFHQHQLLLSELVAMISEFDMLLDIHMEESRLKLLDSGLTSELRRRIWPAVGQIVSLYVSQNKPALYEMKSLAESELEMVSFLYEHRSHYTVDEQGRVLFADFSLLREFNNLGFVNDFSRSLEEFRKTPPPISQN